MQLHKELKDDADLAMIFIDTDEEENTFRDFIKEKGLEAPSLWDPQSKIADGYALKGFPTTFVVDENGNILAANFFETDMRDMLRDFKVRKKLTGTKKEGKSKPADEKSGASKGAGSGG